MAEPPTWTLREMTSADFAPFRELYRAVWGYNRPESFDRWRYLENPLGACPVVLGVDDGRLVGAYTLWPVEIAIGSEQVLGAQSMDTMTHPDYQGQGMFTRLAQACFDLAAERGFEVLYGFPNPASYPGFVRRLGWDHIGDIWHWVRPLRPSAHPRIPKGLGGIADLLSACLPAGSAKGFEIAVGPCDPVEIESEISAWDGRLGGCRVARSAAWFDWRYAPAAENDYEWVTARREGRLLAAGAWGRQSEAWADVRDNRAHLVELIGSDTAARRAVLATILGRARAAGAILIETLTNVPEIESVLRRAGFYRHRRAPYIVKALGRRSFSEDIHAISAWRIAGGDVDTF